MSKSAISGDVADLPREEFHIPVSYQQIFSEDTQAAIEAFFALEPLLGLERYHIVKAIKIGLEKTIEPRRPVFSLSHRHQVITEDPRFSYPTTYTMERAHLHGREAQAYKDFLFALTDDHQIDHKMQDLGLTTDPENAEHVSCHSFRLYICRNFTFITANLNIHSLREDDSFHSGPNVSRTLRNQICQLVLPPTKTAHQKNEQDLDLADIEHFCRKVYTTSFATSIKGGYLPYPCRIENT